MPYDYRIESNCVFSIIILIANNSTHTESDLRLGITALFFIHSIQCIILCVQSTCTKCHVDYAIKCTCTICMHDTIMNNQQLHYNIIVIFSMHVMMSCALDAYINIC